MSPGQASFRLDLGEMLGIIAPPENQILSHPSIDAIKISAPERESTHAPRAFRRESLFSRWTGDLQHHARQGAAAQTSTGWSAISLNGTPFPRQRDGNGNGIVPVRGVPAVLALAYVSGCAAAACEIDELRDKPWSPASCRTSRAVGAQNLEPTSCSVRISFATTAAPTAPVAPVAKTRMEESSEVSKNPWSAQNGPGCSSDAIQIRRLDANDNLPGGHLKDRRPWYRLRMNPARNSCAIIVLI